jgi:hypothetical protein
MTRIIGKSKIALNKFFPKTVILIFLISLFLLLFFHHSLHNHKADGKTHKDCQICILFNFIGFHFLIEHTIIFLFFPVIFRIHQLITRPFFHIYCRVFSSRAPPSDSKYQT